MPAKSAPNTPSKSSRSTPAQVEAPKTPKKKILDIKKITGHNVYDTHYVEYEVVLGSGEKKKATEFEFEKDSKILIDYKQKVSNQIDDSNGDYAVDKILAHRIVNGNLLFLVRWEGYSNPVWNSELWEQDLGNCTALLKKYKDEKSLSSRTPANTPKRMMKKTPKPAPKRVFPQQEDEDDEEEDHEKPPQKAKKQKDSIERVEEVQESDDDFDDDQSSSGPSTSGPAPTEPAKSRWGFGLWRWF